MKEAIGGTWLFGIVIVFIVFFTTFISFSTNYARVFKVKDEVLTIIERYKGVNSSSVKKINDRLSNIGYSGKGKCVDTSGEQSYYSDHYSKWLGCNGDEEPIINSNKSNYCIRKYVISSDDIGPTGHPRSAYYQVVVFFELDWPVVGSLFNTRVDGETSVIHVFDDDWTFS